MVQNDTARRNSKAIKNYVWDNFAIKLTKTYGTDRWPSKFPELSTLDLEDLISKIQHACCNIRKKDNVKVP